MTLSLLLGGGLLESLSSEYVGDLARRRGGDLDLDGDRESTEDDLALLGGGESSRARLRGGGETESLAGRRGGGERERESDRARLGGGVTLRLPTERLRMGERDDEGLRVRGRPRGAS